MRTQEAARSLGALSDKWLRNGFVFRRRAVRKLERVSGFSERMAEAMLDALFSELTTPKLSALLRAELQDPAVLEGFVKDGRNERFVHAKAPRTILHVFSANVPNASVTSFVMGLLLGSRNIGKVSRRDAGMIGIYLDSLKAHDRALWKQCTLIRRRDAVSRWIKEAGLVVVYGNDESLEEIRKEVPVKTPFVGYGHRVSVALVLREALGKEEAAHLAKRMAHDVWMADQRGCLSPVLLFAQKGGRVAAEDFAVLIANELGRLEKGEHSKPYRGLAERVAMRRLEDKLKIEGLKGKSAKYWKSPAGSWMVGYDERLDGEYSGTSQILSVKGFGKLSDLEGILQKMKGSLQATSLECAPAHRKQLAEWLALFGVNRICRAGALQKPPITWHHDGRPNFANWLTWIDLEG